jgi:hypothetical protein
VVRDPERASRHTIRNLRTFWSRESAVRSLRNISAGIGVVVGVVTFATPGLLFALLTAAAAGTVLAAERRLVRLEKRRSAPRRFTDLDRVALIDVIGTDPKGRIHLTAVVADAESLQLANDLKQAFIGAGFHVSGPLVPPLPPNCAGCESASTLPSARGDGANRSRAPCTRLASPRN